MIEFLLSLSVLKQPFYIKTGLNIIPVLFGYFYIIKKRFRYNQIDSAFIPFLIGLLFHILVFTLKADFYVVLRVFQVIGLVMFSHFISEWIDKEKLKKVVDFILLYCVIVAIIEPISRKVGTKEVLSIPLPRFELIVGESTFSGVIAAYLFCIYYIFKDYKKMILSFLFVIMTASKSGFLLCYSFMFFDFLFKKCSELRLRRTVAGICYFVFSFPFLVYLLNKFSPQNIKTLLELKTSGRLYLWIPFVDAGFDHWIVGNGYFNWRTIQPIYSQPYLELMKTMNRYQFNEHHNIFIQVFSDFGIFVYFGFCITLFLLVFKSRLKLNTFHLLFVSLLLAFCFLNGLNEFTIYLTMGLMLSRSKIIEN